MESVFYVKWLHRAMPQFNGFAHFRYGNEFFKAAVKKRPKNPMEARHMKQQFFMNLPLYHPFLTTHSPHGGKYPYSKIKIRRRQFNTA